MSFVKSRKKSRESLGHSATYSWYLYHHDLFLWFIALPVGEIFVIVYIGFLPGLNDKMNGPVAHLGF